MGQEEVLAFLKAKRIESDSWFNAKEVRQGLKDKGASNGVLKGVYDDLFRLGCFKRIEVKGIGFLRQYKIIFRAYKTK